MYNMTTYIIKITCNETGNIFIASTINIKKYINELSKKIRRRERDNIKKGIGRLGGQLSDKLSYNLIYEVDDVKEIFNKRFEAIRLNPECVNDKEWSN